MLATGPVAPAEESPPESSRPASGVRDIEAWRASFAEDGFVVIPQVVPQDPLGVLTQELLREYGRVKSDGTLFSAGGTIAGHLNSFPGRGARFVYDALEQRGVLDFVRSISPRAAGNALVGCNLNLPGSVVQHYHMDSPFTAGFMIANVAAVDTNLENGAIEVVPGSHKRFYKYWRFVVERVASRGRRIPMRRGDVLVRTSTLWHRGMPNRATVPRPMVAFTFPGTAPDHDPFAFNGGHIKFYENWYRTDWIGRLRERTFVAAPFTYSGYRFVASLLGNGGYEPG